ncbi:AAA family ATPase [Methylovulum psychrotolerans]|uniref:Lon protease family protein n=1 Tax=Methylovulum psychrotolerans TaxID=1704499 RepID=UPI001BFFD01F|nr:AAA family ATPase [Methylovulum psychrotolerans]MBT9098895.1 AAA family ATPase [Methylovulum psychrotolerans]
MTSTEKLPITALKLPVDLDGVDFPALAPVPSGILGQDRARAALAFGIAMPQSGYHIFVMGEPGMGRLTMINQHLDSLAAALPTPASFAYVDNFENSREPVALALPAESGQPFRKDIEALLDNLLHIFPAAFESPAYQQKKTAIERQFNHDYHRVIDSVDKKARSMAIALFREDDNITFAPIRDNKTLNEKQFNQLPEAERETFHRQVEELEDFLSDGLLELPSWRRAVLEKFKQLDNDTIGQALQPLLAELHDKYLAIDDVISYLSALEQELYTTIGDYLMPVRGEVLSMAAKRARLLEQYAPHILVDHSQDSGAPVVYEAHPTYQNLFGRIEYASDQGLWVTHYQRICKGSLHKANGGYLILDAEKLVDYPFVWDALKRALKSGYIDIESPYSEMGINTMSLKPEVIPLNVKIILVGSSDIYYLLEELDNEFNEMFKVLADFDDDIPITSATRAHFAALMQKQAADSGARPLTAAAVACLMEHSCRLAENQHRFSARINDTLELIGEANLFAKHSASALLERAHIEQALAAREYRNGGLSQRILDDMLDGTILIDSHGEAIGKINGLTVLTLGGSSFGAPARITATVYPGSRGIVDIEREAELGQAIHSKGVMILTGYLGHYYAQQFPLAISASIAIEQSYSAIDGDSASLAELCCLISALTRTPINQAFAVTGSINQYGEVQAIGGVNEKIEGFFRLCQARGLTGQQAAIIPAANKRNLMLKQEVIDAVAQGLFAVYAVSTVDETLELLTGHLAGEPDAEGNYPEGSINYKAISRLKEISEMTGDDDDKEEGES